MTENKPLGLSDDFNYPPAKRLDVNWTLGREEATTRTKLKTLATREVNRTDDIDGAVTGTTGTNRYLTFLNRNKKGSPFQAGIRTNDPRLSTFDIPGAQSRFALPVSVKRTTDFSLTKSDIEGAQARERNFLSNRKVDPLCPRYALPNAVQPPPPPELPFRRDVLEINDIDGTRTRIKEQIRPRKYTPIDFTAEKPRRRLPSSNEKISLSLKADDICSVTTKRRTNVVDPLNPQYTIHGSNVDFCSHEKRRFHSQSTAQRNFSLRTDDITGAQHVSFIPPPQKRRQWKNTCDVSDIMEGGKRFTSASTRCTNPVNPCYHLPVNWTKTVSLV